MKQQVTMLDKRFKAGLDIIISNRHHHLLMICPNLLQIIKVSIQVQTDRFICVPKCFEQSLYKRVSQFSINLQVKLSMFLIGNLSGMTFQFNPGKVDQFLELIIILWELIFGSPHPNRPPQCDFEDQRMQ